MALYFSSSFIWGLAFASAKLPPLLGYIFSGILLGPSVSQSLSTEAIYYIKEIGNFGLLMLMFVAGLELHIEDFIGENNDWIKPVTTVLLQVVISFLVILTIWLLPEWLIQDPKYLVILALIIISGFFLARSLIKKQWGQIVRFINNLTVTSFAIPISILIALTLCIYFNLLQLNSIFNITTFSLAGCLLSLNSTAIAIKLLENRDKKHSAAGTNLIGILIGQDLVLSFMIIGLQSLSKGISLTDIAIKVSLAFGVLYIVKVLAEAKPSFISNTLDYIFATSKELIAVMSIMLCFACAALSELAGLSDIYGAFIAGLVLGNIYKHNKYIIKICEPISNILMTMFFMWIGAIFNLGQLLASWQLIACLSLSIAVFKYISNLYIIRTINRDNLKLTKGCIILSSLLLTQMSEFSLTMISMVSETLSGQGALSCCNVLQTCAIVSLSIGAVCSVLVKNYLYHVKVIE